MLACTRAMDSGMTWSVTGLSNTTVTSLVINPANPQVLYAATQEGIFKSTDGGNTWLPKNNGTPAACATVVQIDPLKPSTLYALVCDKGLFKTTDGGNAWNPIDNGLPMDGSYFNIPTFILDPQNPSVLYAGVWGVGVYRSLNGGGTWSIFGTGLPDNPQIQTLAASPAGVPCVYVGLYDGVYSTCRGMPTLKSMDRTSAKVGELDVNITLQGDGFTQDATIWWAGAELPTTVNSAEELSASIPAEMLSQAGPVDVNVFVPEPGGGLSDPLTFTVQPGAQLPIEEFCTSRC